MSHSTTQHRCDSPKSVRCAVVTISDTRTIETDRGGALIVEMLTAGGHRTSSRHIVRDDPAEIDRDVPKFLSEMKAEMPAYLLKVADENAVIGYRKDCAG